MGKIVSNFFISLDGVVEAPDQWHFPYWNDEMADAVGRGFETTKALLMGRKGYDEWAAYWPTSTDEPVASMFNEMPKYVVSDHLEEASWSGTTIVRGDVAAELRSIRDGLDGDLSISGSATLVRRLLDDGLVDELRLLVHPVIVGRGQRLFEGDGGQHGLRLARSETFGTGVLDLSYVPA
jgi:dihydrofolate reductase